MNRPTTKNQRAHVRTQISGHPEHEITTRMKLPDGRALHGSVRDIAPGGVGIIGETNGLAVNELYTITLRWPLGAAEIRKCRIKRIDPDVGFDVAFVD